MNQVQIGVVGCGVIGNKHIEAAAASPLIHLVAIADLRQDIAQTLASAHDVATVYQDGAGLIADPNVEAVVLAMPAHVRTEMGLSALSAGKHLLTEKPVAMNADEVRQLLAAQGDRVAACCSSRMHFLPATQAVTDFIATGALGNLRVVRCRAIQPARPAPTTEPPAWRLSKALNGGGIMANWGCYDLDYLLGITGWSLRPQTVLAQTWTVPNLYAPHVAPGSDAETHVAALIRCAHGPTITYERGEYVAAQAEQSWEIMGDAGSLRLHMTPGSNKSNVFVQADAQIGTTQETIWSGDDSWADGHAGPVVDFAQAIQQGRSPQTDLNRAFLVQSITDGIYRSSESGEAVEIDT